MLQRGLIGGLRLSPLGEGVVLPHEDVMPGPVAGLALMEAVRANLEPIFLMYDGAPGAAVRLVDAAASGRTPLLDVATEDGLTHRVWAITDPASSPRSPPTSPRGARSSPTGTTVTPPTWNCRAGCAPPGPDPARGIRAWRCWWTPLSTHHGSTPSTGSFPACPPLPPRRRRGRRSGSGRSDRPARGRPGRTRRSGRRGQAFLIGGGQELHLFTEPDPVQVAAAMPESRSPHWCGLPASILQHLLIGRLWHIRDGEQTVRVVHHDAAAAVRGAAETGGTAVLCNPVSAADVAQVAADGERVPRKSTSFGPKPRTGLLMRTFDQA